MIGQEDCLLLNVYVPETSIDNPDDKLPVMFWIHGGALTAGSNNYEEYGPKHLVEKNLITVHVNYRLGPLGSMFTVFEEHNDLKVHSYICVTIFIIIIQLTLRIPFSLTGLINVTTHKIDQNAAKFFEIIQITDS